MLSRRVRALEKDRGKRVAFVFPYYLGPFGETPHKREFPDDELVVERCEAEAFDEFAKRADNKARLHFETECINDRGIQFFAVLGLRERQKQ